MERPPDERGGGDAAERPDAPPPSPQSPGPAPGAEQPTSQLPEPVPPPASDPYSQPPQGYPPPGVAPYYGPPAVQAKTNGFAVASLVLGILWVYWIGSILALVFGMIAKNQIDQSAGTQQGRGMAIAGIVLGWVGVGFLLLFVVFFGGIAGCGALVGT